ncbi:MAG: hypothetical protein M1510_03495 [Nitrospirae bacterium]|nr:hypothetical protein [Nitrospirota bacterium]MCL5237445.1 hypothetical protein [Nitrospirota bacterium]
MAEIEDIAFKIVAAFEDNYFEVAKRNIFVALFNRYLSIADPGGDMEQYDAITELGHSYRDEFDRMVKELKDRSLIS